MTGAFSGDLNTILPIAGADNTIEEIGFAVPKMGSVPSHRILSTKMGTASLGSDTINNTMLPNEVSADDATLTIIPKMADAPSNSMIFTKILSASSDKSNTILPNIAGADDIDTIPKMASASARR